MVLTVNKLFHYVAGQLLHTGFDLLGLEKIDNAIVSFVIIIGEELIEPSPCIYDMMMGMLGWISML